MERRERRGTSDGGDRRACECPSGVHGGGAPPYNQVDQLSARMALPGRGGGKGEGRTEHLRIREAV